VLLRCASPTTVSRARLSGEGFSRCRASPFALQLAQRGARACCRDLSRPTALTGSILASRALAGALGACALSRWRKIHSRPSRLREADCDRLLRRPCAVPALSNVVNFLAHEFAGLSGRRLPRALVGASPFESGLGWHRVTSGTLRERSQRIATDPMVSGTKVQVRGASEVPHPSGKRFRLPRNAAHGGGTNAALLIHADYSRRGGHATCSKR
jgi:hypothetical protein